MRLVFSRNAAAWGSHGREPMARFSPEGAIGNLSHVAPLGLRGRRWARDHGLAPNGTHFVRNEPRALAAITAFGRETVTRLATAAQ